jgi:uncharacterized protein YjbI with pentapeptide repeats
MSLDFSHQNLRGRSFKGQNLEDANFSYADIRGTDFTGANLKGADFKGAKAGLQLRWEIALVTFSLLLSMLSGLTSTFTSSLILRIVSYSLHIPIKDVRINSGIALFIMLAVLFFVIKFKGLWSALIATICVTIFSGVVGVLFAVLGMVLSAINGALAGQGVAGAIDGAIKGGDAVAGLFLASGAIVFVGISLVLTVLAGAGASASTSTSAGVGAVIIAGLGAGKVASVLAGPSVGIIAAFIVFLSSYFAWQALAKDEDYTLIRKISLLFMAMGGTSFCNADLTNASYTKATLKSTKFKKANLKNTYWYKCENLHLAAVDNTYLKNAKVRELLITKKGEKENFDSLDLSSVNLSNAELTDASLIRANLNEANLSNCNLSRANLVQTQLDGTDFTGATLTGAYIQNWGITSQTKFDGVRCEYVYMRFPTKENPVPYRKPDNNKEVFADGEFGDFIKPIFDTLDLYHNQGVDPRAIAISFKQLAENHPEADLRIVGMEVRGEDKFLLRAKTTATADKSELSAEYFATYNQFKELSGQELRALIAAENIYTRKLENMFKTALERPSVNVQGDNNKVVQRDTNMTGDRNINTGGGNYNEKIQGNYVQGNYYAAGQPQSLAQAAGEIQQLLKQLEQTYPTTTTSQQMVVAAEAINQIESNPLLKERVINAVKSGGLAAFEKAIDNPAGAFIVGAIKGWQSVEAED